MNTARNTARDSHPRADVREIRVAGCALHAFVAIDSTQLGPAFGGCRFRPYQSSSAARTDALRLAHGMTLKNALAGIPFGGGKAVIMEPREPYDRDALFAAFGREIEALGGCYITAMDSGTTTADMDTIGQNTRYVSGRTHAEGDPSPYTAHGVYRGIEVALARRGTSLEEARIAIQGVGHVGAALARGLANAGAELVIADPVAERAEAIAAATGAHVVAPEALLETTCDVLAPCGLGGILNHDTVAALDCRIVAGATNNQLAAPNIASALAARGILYVPDFLLNAGGVIHAALAWAAHSDTEICGRVDQIGDTVSELLEQADQRQTAPLAVAQVLAERRLAAA